MEISTFVMGLPGLWNKDPFCIVGTQDELLQLYAGYHIRLL